VRRGIFVTGTDTGVGKTVVACALLRALAARGVDVMPMKPIAAGARRHSGRWANDDTMALLRAAGRDETRADDVTPVLLREPMAPHIAAARENRRIRLEPVRSAFQRLAANDEFVVAEGVGGFVVPLDADLDTVDLARVLGLPVVLVVGLRLGCLNHALLTARAIAAAGLPFAGWIANTRDATMAVPDENVAALEERLEAPLLGRLPLQATLDLEALASLIDVGPLLARR
jgi:dethiobiotin synthetase